MNKLQKIFQNMRSLTVLRGITYLKEINPITTLHSPSKETTEYLVKLIQDLNQLGSLEEIRKKFNISEKGIDIKPFAGKNFSDIPPINNKLVLSSLEVIANDVRLKLGLSDDFITQLLLLIFFNAFIDIKYFEGFITHPIQFVLGRRNISNNMFDYSHEVGAVILPFNTSQNRLVTWIEDHWNEINRQMNNNLTTDPYLLRLHKNTEIALEIVDMKDKQEMSYFDIADELAKRYPENEHVKDGEWVKKTYQNYKEMWNSLPKELKDK